MTCYRWIGVTGLVLCLVASTVLTGAVDAAEKPLFRVGTKSYTLADIAGVEEATLLKQCREVLRPQSLDALLEKLSEEQRKEVLALPEPKRREAAERLRFRMALRPLTRRAFQIILFAGITDRIVAEHGVDLEDYFDIELVRRSVRRSAIYGQYLYKSPDDESADERLRQEMNRALGIQWTKEAWRKSRTFVRSLSPLGRWHPSFSRSPYYEELSWKAVLVHALLKKACDDGIYARQAAHLIDVEKSDFLLIRISSYQGDRRHLEEFVDAALKDGEIRSLRDDPIKELGELLRKTSPSLQLRGTFENGGKMIHGYSAFPVGKLIEFLPGQFLLYTWNNRFRFESLSPADKKALRTPIVNYSFPLGALDYFPDVEVYAKDLYPLDPVGELPSLTSDGMLPIVGLEMAVKGYDKKPYPAEPFAQHRECTTAIQAALLRAVAAHTRGDKDAVPAVIADLRKAAEQAGPKFVQQKYRHAADTLENQLNQKDNPSQP
ncbi:MAG TPA: hypothetical protein VH682_09400 [Gemmataceae bacterium]|jgi:hypothetical protein